MDTPFKCQRQQAGERCRPAQSGKPRRVDKGLHVVSVTHIRSVSGIRTPRRAAPMSGGICGISMATALGGTPCSSPGARVQETGGPTSSEPQHFPRRARASRRGRPWTRALPAARLLGASLGGFAHLNHTVSWAHLLSLSFPIATPAHLGPPPLDPDSASLISWATRPAVTAQNCAGRVHFPQSRSLAFTWIIWFHLVPSSDSMGVSPGTRFSNASEPLAPPTRGPS